MKLKTLALAIGGLLAIAATADAQRGGGRSLTFYSQPDYSGQSVTINQDVTDFRTINFNDRALSVRVTGNGSWTICQDSNFRGVCRQISADVPRLSAISLDGHVSSARMEYDGTTGGRPGGGRPGSNRGPRNGIRMFDGRQFSGQILDVQFDNSNLTGQGFNDRAESVQIARGETWEFCEHANFRGRCITLEGRVGDLGSYRMDNQVSSVRQVRDSGGYPGGGYPGGGYNDGSLTLWAGPNFTGQSVTLDREVNNLTRQGWNDRAMSARVNGYGNWTVCEDEYFGSPCRVISGEVRNFNSYGLGNRITSARPEYGNGDPGYGGPGGGWNPGYGQDSYLVLYSGPNFSGQSIRLDSDTTSLVRNGWNDRAMSAEVIGDGSWTVCEDVNYGSPCRQIDGRVRNLNALGLGNRISSARPDPVYGGPGYGGQFDSITLYSGYNFTGQSVTIDRETYNLEAYRFNDRTMSLRINGYGNWIICEHVGYGGRCQQVANDVANLNAWGLSNRISSVRPY